MRNRNLNKSMETLFPQESDSSCRECGEPVVDGRWNYCSERTTFSMSEPPDHWLY